MPLLFWNPFAITMLVEAILVSIFSLYLGFQLIVSIRHGGETKISALLFVVFTASALAIFFQFLSTALPPQYVDYALPWVSPAGAVATMFFVLFAHNFARKPTRKPTWKSIRFDWGQAVLAIALTAITVMEFAIAIMRIDLLTIGRVEYREAWVDTSFVFEFVVALVFFARTVLTSIAAQSKRNWLRCLLPTLGALLWPPTQLEKDGRAARAFFYASIVPVSLALVLFARSNGWIAWHVAEPLALLCVLLTYGSFALVYLNYVPERTSFRVKLVGISLTTVLFIFCGVSWLIGSVYVSDYENKNLVQSGTALRFEPQPDGAYTVSQTGSRFETALGDLQRNDFTNIKLPFEFPFFSEIHNEIFVRKAGMIGFNDAPIWRDILHGFGPEPAIYALAVELQEMATDGASGSDLPNQSGLYIRENAGEVIITWNQMVSPFSPQDQYTFQLKLFVTGVIEMVYQDLPIAPQPDLYRAHQLPMLMGIVPAFAERQVTNVQFATALPLSAPPHHGLIEFHRAYFLTYLDRIYAPVAQFTLLATLMTLIIFPLFFSTNLDRPLKHLIAGVREILGGRLSTSIKVFHQDELGFLAKSFNTMAKAQNELVQSLEDKVAARTAEASEFAANNARLKERAHMSRELHDAVSQTLFSANLIASTIPDLWEKDPARAKQSLLDVQQLNKSALLEMRQFLLEVSPKNMTNHSLGRLLRQLVDEFHQQHAVDVTLQIERDAILPNDVQLAFYRIAQESIWNAIKHAHCSRISISLDGMNTQAMLVVKDDGIGFQVGDSLPSQHGLRNMAERMRELGGTFEIQSTSNHGTMITAIWIEEDNG